MTPDPGLTGSVRPVEIETYGDHRIAMSMALVGLRVGGLSILDPDCTAKTYPQFWRDFSALGVRLEPR